MKRYLYTAQPQLNPQVEGDHQSTSYPFFDSHTHYSHYEQTQPGPAGFYNAAVPPELFLSAYDLRQPQYAPQDQAQTLQSQRFQVTTPLYEMNQRFVLPTSYNEYQTQVQIPLQIHRHRVCEKSQGQLPIPDESKSTPYEEDASKYKPPSSSDFFYNLFLLLCVLGFIIAISLLLFFGRRLIKYLHIAPANNQEAMGALEDSQFIMTEVNFWSIATGKLQQNETEHG